MTFLSLLLFSPWRLLVFHKKPTKNILRTIPCKQTNKIWRNRGNKKTSKLSPVLIWLENHCGTWHKRGLYIVFLQIKKGWGMVSLYSHLSRWVCLPTNSIIWMYKFNTQRFIYLKSKINLLFLSSSSSFHHYATTLLTVISSRILWKY